MPSPEVGEIICAACEVVLEGPTEPEPESRFRCPRCGVSDTYENVMKEAQAYVEEQTAKQLQKDFAAGVRGKGLLKFDPQRVPKRDYRFIVRLA